MKALKSGNDYPNDELNDPENVKEQLEKVIDPPKVKY